MAAGEIIVEKWICNACVHPCRVEILYEGCGVDALISRFKKTCVCGYKKDKCDWRKEDEQKKVENRELQETGKESPKKDCSEEKKTKS